MSYLEEQERQNNQIKNIVAEQGRERREREAMLFVKEFRQHEKTEEELIRKLRIFWHACEKVDGIR